MKVISDADAIDSILNSGSRYALYLGAGASVDAGVPAAKTLCDRIRVKKFESAAIDRDDPLAVEQWADATLDWSDTSRRYLTCIYEGYPTVAERLEYFRNNVLGGIKPSFSHHATAALVAGQKVRPTVLTTNFDQLLESAFSQMGAPCQSIRTAEECQFWHDRDDRFFIVKLHGDIDTLNILNTRQETNALNQERLEIVDALARRAGLVVLGTSANEQSIHRMFDIIGRSDPGPNGVLPFGLLWGVYMDAQKPKHLTQKELERQVQQRVSETEISRTIIDLIGDSANPRFCFFPIWGIDQFMLALIERTGDKTLVAQAKQHLDHDMRLRDIFSRAGLSDLAISKHLARLQKGRKAMAKTPADRPQIELFRSGTLADSGCTIQFLYGDITSRSMMSGPEFATVRRAIVSPEDTFVSAGGGVAYQLLQKAGSSTILNELSKFAPIPHRTVAVTSAGALPIHYIFHAAALEIGADAEYLVSAQDVAGTMRALLESCQALDIGVVWTPLLGAGVADLRPRASLEGLLSGIRTWADAQAPGAATGLTVAIVIYRERLLGRHEVDDAISAFLGAYVVEDEPEPASAGT